MNSVDHEVLAGLLAWQASGYRAVLITVARTWGSSPRPAGSWAAIRDDGQVIGSVSGGCVEDDLIGRVVDGSLMARGPRPFTLSYGVTGDEAARFGLPCGGKLELMLESAPDTMLLAELRTRITHGECVMRRVVRDGGVTLHDAGPDTAVSFDGATLQTVHGPRWRLFIVGAGQISQYLARMAPALDYRVTVCDPREEYASQWAVPGSEWAPGMPDDALLAWHPDTRSAIVALTHDPKLDDLVLIDALRAPAFYVGALGSRRSQARRRERLAQHFGLSPDELERLHGPVGLPIGSRTPPEIAVAILAEMTAVKNGAAMIRQAGLPA
ncbi:MAG: XdhC family protein [Proteobacteria bacterium]|nr:XdhC family protein [Pseudomonadota bacterium]HQR04540.1 XdhC family protein [Rhodocyclaceae bacterium]